MHANRSFSIVAAQVVVLAGLVLVHVDYATGQVASPAHQSPGTVELFAPGVISTDLGERDASFHPSGNELYFTLWTGRFGVIMVSKSMNGRWTQPQTASFSGYHSDLEPFVTTDGERLYFASTRPVESDGKAADYNLWYVERVGDDWSSAKPLNDVNTEADEFYPTVDQSGVLYWTAAYEDSFGGEDIWLASPTDSGFSKRVNAGPGVNTGRDEFNAMISPDGSWLAFGSFGRDDGFGGGDLYISFRGDDGMWQDAINMGPEVNSPHLDFCPGISPDARAFLFSSRRTGLQPTSEVRRTYDRLSRALREPGNGRSDIYWVSADLIDDLREKALN